LQRASGLLKRQTAELWGRAIAAFEFSIFILLAWSRQKIFLHCSMIKIASDNCKTNLRPRRKNLRFFIAAIIVERYASKYVRNKDFAEAGRSMRRHRFDECKKKNIAIAPGECYILANSKSSVSSRRSFYFHPSETIHDRT
jgi:hypothetical protein